MEWVQVQKSHLLEYISYVEALSSDHTKLQQKIKDTEEISKIMQKTYEERIDKILDKILDQTNRSQYYSGLHDAYQIMKGRRI